MRVTAHGRRRERGFSLIELLITIFLAGIIFLAMVPLFVSGLKTTSSNTRRVVATNIAQARLETIKMLAASMAPTPNTYSTTATTGYAAITPTNLTSGTWNAALLPTTYTPPSGGAPYSISYSVTCSPSCSPSAWPTVAAKIVSVTVTRNTDNFKTTVSTVLENPQAVTTSSTSGPTGGNGPYSLVVAFKNYTEVDSSRGVSVVYINTVPTPNVTTTATPTKQVPSSLATTCTWTNLPGGMNYLYQVFCYSDDWNSGTSALYTPVFHMLSNGWVKFDTNPGGS